MAKEIERKQNEENADRLPRRRPSEFISPWFENFLSPLDDFSRIGLDVEESDKEFIICADLPGVSKDDLGIDTCGNQITLLAVRHWDRKLGRREEQGRQTYRRTFTLPVGVDMEKIEANFTDGVLTVIVPKGEDLKSRHIKIGDGKSEHH